MNKDIIFDVSREEIVEILQEKYDCKFTKNRLSPKGFRGWTE